MKRKSPPNVGERGVCEGFGAFMGVLRVSNLARDERIDYRYYKTMHLDNVEMPPLSFLTRIARKLRRVMKPNLFNFDVIRDSNLFLLTFCVMGTVQEKSKRVRPRSV
ncbi:hypothetical protein ACSQ67_009003 [Phaseolus vulgaris]